MRKGYKPGSFFRIPLTDGSFGYGRMLKSPYDAFYDYRTVSPDSDLDRIASRSVLFITAVRYPKSDPWELIGWRALEASLTGPISRFMQDVGDFRRCTIFDTVGNQRDASPQECIGLERAAVWEQHGIEERLLDSFMGRTNSEVERMKVRLS